MDYGVPDQNVAVYGEEEPQYEGHYEAQQQRNYNSVNSVDDSAGIKHDSSSSAGKLFVGGIAWETSEEAFSRYFRKYGEITDSVIMLDKISGRPRGFGFITFADPEVADKVLQEDHVIDGRAVEVKRTVPREDMNVRGGAPKTKKIFVGGLPLSLYDDDLKEYFSSFGNVVEHQIMMDRDTGRSRGFGFVTFENEDAVEQILSNGRMHEIGGKQVEIKRAEPKRSGFDNSTETRFRRGGSGSRSSGNFASGSEGYGGGYGGKVGRAYGGGYGGGYGGYGNLAGNYAGGAAGFYPGYGGGYGYGYGFGGPMYGGGAYGGGGYGVGAPVGYGGAAGYGLGGRGYSGGGGGYDGDEGFGTGGGGGGGGYGPSKGYVGGGSGGGGGGASGYGGSKGYGNGGASSGRFHPYRK